MLPRPNLGRERLRAGVEVIRSMRGSRLRLGEDPMAIYIPNEANEAL
jgi:hypothetical protein